jgi:protein-S-isoprenylcysteine O-methyltransferase Ste14
LSLQGVAFVIVWSARRPPFTPILSTTRPVEILIAAATALLAAASLWLTVAAIKALGKQWSLSARLIEGHELVVEGPYRLARHPIYTGTLGMLMATGLSFSHWMALLLSIPIFAAGTLVRIRIEERLLRERFGARYDAYAKRVAAIVPFLI